VIVSDGLVLTIFDKTTLVEETSIDVPVLIENVGSKSVVVVDDIVDRVDVVYFVKSFNIV
jgi:phosphoribosylpyrophosphate synthetase